MKIVTEGRISFRLEREAGEPTHAFYVPPRSLSLVQKRLASGSFENAEEVFRRALETWTPKRAGLLKNAALSMKKSTARLNRLALEEYTVLTKRAGSWMR